MKLLLPLLIMAMLCYLPGAAQEQCGDVKGNVMYRTDDGRPHWDAGAEVIIYYIDSARPVGMARYDRHHAEDSIIFNAQRATMYYDLWQHSPIGRTQKQMRRKLQKLDAWPVEELQVLDRRAAAIITEREVRQYVHAVTDNYGRFAVRLRPGYYGIIIRSRHLRSQSLTERGGKILLDDADMRAGQTVIRNEEIL